MWADRPDNVIVGIKCHLKLLFDFIKTVSLHLWILLHICDKRKEFSILTYRFIKTVLTNSADKFLTHKTSQILHILLTLFLVLL